MLLSIKSTATYASNNSIKLFDKINNFEKIKVENNLGTKNG